MNLGTFACIVSFGLHTGTDNIRDYAGLYTKDPYLALIVLICFQKFLTILFNIFSCLLK